MKKEKISKQMYIDWYSVAPGVWRIRDLFVNVYLIHNPSANNWVLLDAGLKTTASKIKKVADHLFWPDTAPAAIIFTLPATHRVISACTGRPTGCCLPATRS